MQRTIYFWGTHADLEIARALAQEDKNRKDRAITRDAAAFAGDVEPCDRIVLLSSVPPAQAKRITTAYHYAKISVETLDGAPPVPVIDPKPERTPNDLAEKLRRLTNRELRQFAHEHAVHVDDARDRATMIARIIAADQKG
jgi:hypothetical protein